MDGAFPDRLSEAGARSASPALARLLGGEPAAALAERFGKDAWRGQVSAEAARALFDWPRLNAVLTEHRFDGSRLYLSGGRGEAIRDGSGRILAAPLLAALRGGATLILNAANEASAPLRALCADLAADFTCFCQANLYACWGVSPGFDVHWDDHDVLVVQAEGRKRWALYGLAREAPTLREDPADHRPPAGPLEQIVLDAGDVLYLPRGYWHAAVGAGEPSLHLTIGLTRRTGWDFLRWLADQALSDPVVRRDLPFEQGDGAVADQLARVVAAVANRSPADLARAYRRQVEAEPSASSTICLPAIGGAETRPSDTALLTLAPGAARLEHGPSAEAVVLSWRGTRFTLSASIAPLLERLVAGEPLPFGELAASASPGRALAFVREMVGRGVMLIHAPPRTGCDDPCQM